jgi:hypothetical protein
MSQALTQYSINGSSPSTVGGTGTAIKYFPNLPGPSIGVSNLTPSATSAAGQLLVPGSNRLNGQSFNVLATGNFAVGVGGGSSTVTFTLRANTGTVAAPVYTTIAASGAYAAEASDGVFYPFDMNVKITGDSLSALIQGTQTFLIDNTISTAGAALTSTLAGLLPSTSNSYPGINPVLLPFQVEPVFGLVLGVTFGTSVVGNTANLYNFAITN